MSPTPVFRNNPIVEYQLDLDDGLMPYISDSEIEGPKRTYSWYFWKFVHNMFVHPLLAFPYEPKWLQDLHDWTADRCEGGG